MNHFISFCTRTFLFSLILLTTVCCFKVQAQFTPKKPKIKQNTFKKPVINPKKLQIKPSNVKTIQALLPGVGSPKTLKVEEINGEYIYEGDIVIPPNQVWDASKSITFSVIITGNEFRWPNATIPYTIDEAFDRTQRRNVLAAIQNVSNQTNLCLVERNREQNYVHFKLVPGVYSSSVGMVGNRQTIKVSDSAVTGRIMHEILHAAGLFHEHTRSDRDQYVEILWDNIRSDKKHNFEVSLDRPNGAVDFGAYDFGSVMHYGNDYFGKTDRNGNKMTTIRPKRMGAQIGQRARLSNTDIAGVNAIYPTPCGSNGGGNQCLTRLPQSNSTGNYQGTSVLINFNGNTGFRRGNIQRDKNTLTNWVVRFNGEKIKSISARNGLNFNYNSPYNGNYDVFIEQFINGAYRRISNVLSYNYSCGTERNTTGEVTIVRAPSSPRPGSDVTLHLNNSGLVRWGDIRNDNNRGLQLVIKHNNRVVLKWNAEGKKQYKYFGKKAGTYVIYMEQHRNGRYQVISNVVSYRR